MKCRKMTWNELKNCYDIVWFGSKGKNENGKAIFVDENGKTIQSSQLEYVEGTDILTRNSAKKVHNNFSEDADAVVESLRQRLSVMKNELWNDYLYGLPLLQEGVTKAMIDSDAILMISYCPGVRSLNSFKSEIDVSSKTYKLEFDISTIYGDVSVSV